jgi:hypothetical protein
MKEGFIKNNRASLFFVVVFIAVAIYLRDIIIGVVAAVFTLVFLNHYRKYDADIQAYDEWWEGLDKQHKGDLYDGRLREETTVIENDEPTKDMAQEPETKVKTNDV